MRTGLASLIGIVLVVAAALAATLAAGFRPLLGIDLTGGVEVILEAADDPNRISPPSADELDQAVQILRNRVDALDVAQPDITRQGSRVVVQLPDVEDQQRAIELVGTTAELQFRPVCAVLPAAPIDFSAGGIELDADNQGQITGDISPENEADSGAGDGDNDSTEPDATGDDPESTDADAPAESTDADDPVEIDPDDIEEGEAREDLDDAVDDLEENGFGGFAGDGEYAVGAIPAQDDEPSPTEFFDDATAPTGPCSLDIAELAGQESTPRQDFVREESAVLDQVDDFGNVVARYYVGPVPSIRIDGEDNFLIGSTIEDAQSVNTGFQAIVLLTLRPGDTGISLFNDMAGECFNQSDQCPTRQMAIVLDGKVESAPAIQVPAFDRNGIQISGGFDEDRAADTALVLRYGSLPVELEQQQVRTVSSSLGSDSLTAGIISGLIGLFLVAAYMIAYYRLLGVAALLSLAVSGTLLWVLISFFSETGFFFSGVTLTIAGIVGLIVSMGVSLDSNVVYFEHLKEDIANGRTLRSAVDRSFPVAYRTIFYADMAALIGAVILYTLTTASVREFALMLGLASVLDLVATYFFLRPLVRLLSRTQRAIDSPGFLGLPPAPTRAR